MDYWVELFVRNNILDSEPVIKERNGEIEKKEQREKPG